MRENCPDCRHYKTRYIGATVGGARLTVCTRCGIVFCEDKERKE